MTYSSSTAQNTVKMTATMIDSLSELTIRQAQPQEAERLAEMTQAMALETEGRKLEAETVGAGVKGVFEKPERGTYWMMELNNKPIGFILIGREWSEWHNANYWWIKTLYIAPEARGKGIFEEALAKLEDEARAADAPELRLYVEQENHRAMRVYDRNGFEGEYYNFMSKKL